mgnify:CR=1 FL=1
MSLPWADLWLTPFLEFGFMQRALLGGVAAHQGLLKFPLEFLPRWLSERA